CVPLCPRRQLGGVEALCDMIVIGGWGDRQNLADRLDPVMPSLIVDEGDHGLNRRSSSAWAKYADALRRISLAWRNSRPSRSRSLIRRYSGLVGPDHPEHRARTGVSSGAASL